MVIDEILLAREERSRQMKRIAQESDAVSVKANVPGWIKNLPQANAVAYTFAAEIKKMGGYELRFLKGADGLTVFAKVNDGLAFKKRAVELEKTHPLGRLADIDVFQKGEEKSLSRGELRKCFLCDRAAFHCGRNKTHTTGELLRFFISTTERYFSEKIAQIVEESMLAELNIENKFGLVTPTSCGSHEDLNYDIMRRAITAVKEPLAKAFTLGLTTDDADGLTEKLKAVGLECEREMMKATKGANAYKGFIFVGGVLLATLGALIKNGHTMYELNATCRAICKGFTFPDDTFGAKAYAQGFGGIRESAANGFSIVERAEGYVKTRSLEEILTFIVGNIEDSVLFKRAGSLEKYAYFKDLISNADKAPTEREKITKECIENDISIGGAADILIATVLLNKIKGFLFAGEI